MILGTTILLRLSNYYHCGIEADIKVAMSSLSIKLSCTLVEIL